MSYNQADIMIKKELILATKGEVGGAQNFVISLAKGLKEKGLDIIIGTGAGGKYLDKAAADAGITFTIFPCLGRSYNPFRVISTILFFKKYFNQNKFDAVHLNSSNALPVAMAAKMSKNKPKTIFTFHGLSFLDPSCKKNSFIKLLFRIYYKKFLSFIDEAIFVCRTNLEYAKKIHLVKSGNVIYNGIQPRFADKSSARGFMSQKIGVDLTNKLVIGSIGRLAYPKNYEFFITNFADIVKNYQDAIGIIIGGGPEKNKYEQKIEHLGLKNKFFLLGEIENASQYLSGFDIFTLTSEFEGLPITLMEAMTAGVPILAGDVGGIPEILNGTAVQLYSAGSDLNYRENLIKLMHDGNLREQLSSINKQKASDFSVHKMVSEYFNIL